MKNRLLRTILSVAIGTAGVLNPAPCHAGLFDWMFPGRTNPYAVYYPNYYNNYGGAYSPYYSAGYSPYGAYGTNWNAVPTTVFRPVATPTATLMQPYSTYSYQAQRVPYYALQPSIPWTAPAAAPTCGACATPYSAGYAPASPCQSLATPWQSVGTTSYYVPPAPTVTTNYLAPSCSSPAVTLPADAIVSNYSAPSTVTSPSCGGYSSAADFAPSLNSLPATTNYAPVPSPSCSSCANGLGGGTAYPSVSNYSGLSTGSDGATATPWEPVTSAPPTASTAPNSTDWQPYNGSPGGSSVPANNRPEIDPSVKDTSLRPTSFTPAYTRPDAWARPGTWTPHGTNAAGTAPSVPFNGTPSGPSSFDYRSVPRSSPIPDPQGLSTQPGSPLQPTRPSRGDDEMMQTASISRRHWEAIPITWPDSSAGGSIPNRAPEARGYAGFDPAEGNWRQARP